MQSCLTLIGVAGVEFPVSGKQMGDIIIHDVGFRLYANQPVEIDARNFAADVLARLEDKGIVTPSQRN